MKTIKTLICNERIVLGAVVLNTTILFLGGFWPESKWPEICDEFFTIVFLFEAITKISAYGWTAYWKQGWNRFDFIILLVALPSLASMFIDNAMATNPILALRSLRLFKSFKVLRFIPNIQKLLKGLKLACRASFFVLVAFVVFLVLFSILSSTIFGKVAPDYFNNPAISLYSIFRLFSVEGWYEIPEAIASHASPSWGIFARCYFSVLMFIGGIIGMSLINSIFVDAMAEDNNDEVLEKLSQIEKQLKEMSRYY